jgi:hypothetical protein
LRESDEEYDNDTEYKQTKKLGPHGFIPCRRICSTTHNPAFHKHRHGRGQGPVAKSQKRVTSADTTKQRVKREAEGPDLDWKKTEINQYINVAKFDIDQGAQGAMTTLDEIDRTSAKGASLRSYRTTKDIKTDKDVEM